MGGFIWTLLIGAIAGWIAGQLTRGQGFGIVTNIILGVVGAFVGNFALSLLGLAAYGTIGQLVASVIGSVIILWIGRMFSPIKKA